MGQPPLHGPAGERVQQAAVPDHRRRHRTGRRLRRRHARRARLRGRRLHVPRLAAAGALDRRPGRDQRGEGLPQRRRQHLPALLRHDQGRRLPLARGERVPARAGLERDHRPGDGAGRAVRARVRRAARQPLVRRRAGLAHVLRARADRPAAAARRLPGDDAPGRRGKGDAAHADRDARRRGRRRPGGRRRGAGSAGRGRPLGERARGGAGDRRLLERLLSLHEREGVERDRDLARAQARRGAGESVLHADPSDLHPAVRRHAVQAHADERVAAQ